MQVFRRRGILVCGRANPARLAALLRWRLAFRSHTDRLANCCVCLAYLPAVQRNGHNLQQLWLLLLVLTLHRSTFLVRHALLWHRKLATELPHQRASCMLPRQGLSQPRRVIGCGHMGNQTDTFLRPHILWSLHLCKSPTLHVHCLPWQSGFTPWSLRLRKCPTRPEHCLP